MKKNIKAKICAALFLLAAFALWTWAVSRVDVLPVGPQGSAVGFASVNRRFHQFTGVHWGIYTLTDWLGLIPIATAALFGLLGLCQWIRRKSLRKVDPSLFLLAGFYGAVMAAYVLFEIFPVNYRPVLIEGVLEASYPSSTTLLMLTVLPTAALQLRGRIRSPLFRRCAVLLILLFAAVTVMGRLISGVHWITDIIGGVLLSAGLVTLYDALCSLIPDSKKPS